MHDCSKFKDRLVDLLFEPESEGERARLLAEMSACESCASLYRSMSETIAVFDQVARTVLPEESWWPGYDERLRARLTEQAKPERGPLASLSVKNLLSRFPLPLRVAFACLAVAAGAWLLFNRAEKRIAPPPAVVNNAGPGSEQKKLAENNEQPRQGEQRPGEVVAQKERLASPRRARGRKPERAVEQAYSSRAPERRDASADYLDAEIASHVEEAELLMRAFRNIKPSGEQTTFDVSYEKQLSKELLAKNMLLRRSAENRKNAESRKNLAVEDLLSSIEPLLLDIANLPDRPAQDDVRSIKDLMQRQEVVAALQFYSAKATSRNY
jgi:hypothetical protein